MQARILSREEAREILTRKVAAKPPDFSTYPWDAIVEDARWKLRWIDCAPDGARHQAAPMQDKQGVPCGDCWDENVGPGQALREARIRRGLNPFSGSAD